MCPKGSWIACRHPLDLGLPGYCSHHKSKRCRQASLVRPCSRQVWHRLSLSKLFFLRWVVPIEKIEGLIQWSKIGGIDLLTLIADRNSLKLTFLEPSLSKCLSKTSIYSVFRLIPKSLNPFSNSVASRVLLLSLSMALNTWARPLIVKEPLCPRVDLISAIRVGPS